MFIKTINSYPLSTKHFRSKWPKSCIVKSPTVCSTGSPAFPSSNLPSSPSSAATAEDLRAPRLCKRHVHCAQACPQVCPSGDGMSQVSSELAPATAASYSPNWTSRLASAPGDWSLPPLCVAAGQVLCTGLKTDLSTLKFYSFSLLLRKRTGTPSMSSTVSPIAE